MLKRLTHLNPGTKYLIHFCALFSFVIGFNYSMVFAPQLIDADYEIDPWKNYGTAFTYLLYLCRILAFLTIPQCLFNFCGLIFYNPFSGTVEAKSSPQQAPSICFRVVTRGDFPDLIRQNLERNMKTCRDVSLENFRFEIATDQEIIMSTNETVRQTVVPASYKTHNDSMFKARALQYCLENEVNKLEDFDWIVHLDEETLMTENAVRGILNFVHKGKHEFGQGVITYANCEIRNWLTTLADSFRVGEDYGKIRFQFLMFHRPIFGIKGSYVVTSHKAERSVSFDHGPDGSVAEDCFFSMMAYKSGYSFDFIEGEMHEKSPFNLRDFLQQRKRWLQGIWLVVHSPKIPFKNKCFLSMSLYGWLTLPLTTSNMLWTYLYPLPTNQYTLIHVMLAFSASVNAYLYALGAVKSFTVRRNGFFLFIFCVVGSLVAIPFNVIIENIAVLWGIISKKHKFYVVKKV